MDKELFVKELEKINVYINDEQLKQLDKYYQLLIEWNKKINLTRIVDEKDVYLKHFYDSITLCKVVDLHQKLSLCDIGTGAGFPGIVLKIVFPSLNITLVDSLNKRIEFLKLVIKELALNDIEAVHVRGEDYARINREKYDIVTSRAVANLSILAEISIPLCKVNGYFIAMKANCEDEVKNVKNLLNKLDSKIIEINEFDLPIENSHRTLVKIEKNRPTNVKYPRSFEKIIKNR